MPSATEPRTPRLHRGIGTAGALGANIIDMVGVGPFITLPLIVSLMGGPQAMLGWLLGALLSLLEGQGVCPTDPPRGLGQLGSPARGPGS